ncbi:MAG: hypothetical protein IT462_15065 [Planctomycetes bacterium]|nr:hypothetical protein [Planctomycetota bacterium]
MKTATITLLFLLVSPLLAQAPDYAALETIYLDASIGELDYDAYAAKLIALCEKNPASEEAVLALIACQKFDKMQSSSQPVYAMLKKLAKDDFKGCGKFASSFARAYLHWARRIEIDANANAVARRWNGITTAMWCGPFAEPGASAHDDAFQPEVRLYLDRNYTGAYGPVSFRPVPHFDANDDELDIFDAERHHGQCYYVATSIFVSRATAAMLSLDFMGPGKVWLRGAPLVDFDARAGECPRTYLNVQLAQGENLLLVKISSISNLRVRIRGADGRPIEGMRAAVPTGGPFEIRGGKPAIENPRPMWSAKFDAELKRLEGSSDARQTALCRLALASLCDQYDLKSEGTLHLEAAMEAMPKNTGISLAFVRALDESPLYSPSGTRRAKRTVLADLVKASDKPLPAALVELGKSFARDERTHDVVDCMQKALTANPRAWTVWLELSEYYRQLSWRAEWFASLRKAEQIAPKAPAVLMALANYHNSGDALRQEYAYRNALTAVWPGDRDTRLSMISLLLRLGRADDARKMAEAHRAADPGDRYARQRLAEVYFATGKLDDGLKLCDELASQCAEPDRYLRIGVKALINAGDETRARQWCERVVAANPSDSYSRRLLMRMKGESGEFWKEHSLTFEDAKKAEPNEPGDGRAHSAMVLDEMVQQVFADGSSITYVHQIRKILTLDGVDERGRDRVMGAELITARTIKPDGTVLEPVTFAGNQVEYPGVEVGCYLEIAYLQFTNPSPYRTLYNDRFYFEDQALNEPFYISRWVLLAPQTMALNIRQRNLDEGPNVDIRQFNKGDQAVYIWDVRSRRHLEKEGIFAPGALELIPWLEIVQPSAWQRKARIAAEYGLRRTRVTPLVEKVAADVLKGQNLSDEQKARKLYEWVNANLLTSGDTQGAHQALRAMAGSREEVFLSLCKAAGVKVGFAMADTSQLARSTREERPLIADWVSPANNDFNTFLVVVTGDDGKRIYLSLDERLRPFGAYGARYDGAPVILWNDGRYEQTFLPGGAPDRDLYISRSEITLKADGSADVSGSLELFGERSYSIKEQMRNTSREQLGTELEGDIASQFPGFSATSMDFPDIGTLGKPYVRKYAGTSPALAQKSRQGLTCGLPIAKMAAVLASLASREKRKMDMLLDFDLHWEDEIRIKAPAGFNFSELPADTLYPCAPFLYSLTYKLEDGVLVVKRKVGVGPGRISASSYPQFLGQLARVRAAEDIRIKLAPTATDAAKTEDVVPK